MAKACKWAEAAAAYEKSLALVDTSGARHFALGIARAKLGDWVAAAAAYEAGLVRNDNQPRRYLQLGFARAKLRDWAAAAAAYETGLARMEARGRWHSRLGRARAQQGHWDGAAAAYEAALSYDGEMAAWHLALGRCREALQDWKAAAGAYRRALNLDPDDESCRCRLALCLERSGRKADAVEAVAPFLAESDRFLGDFLAQRGEDGGLDGVITKPVFRSWIKRRPARQVKLDRGGKRATYFEQLRLDGGRSERVRDFHLALERKFGEGIPDFVPRLHHCSIGARHGYFLYDYLERAPAASRQVFDPSQELDLGLARRIVDCLVRIARELHEAFGPEIPAHGAAQRFCGKRARQYLADASSGQGHSDDYARALESACGHWPGQWAWYLRQPRVFAHGDTHDENIVISSDGRISIVDWEVYGWAPMGLDLVTLFENRLDCDAFEDLMHRYFDGLGADLGLSDRRRMVAVLSVLAAEAKERPLSEKWVRHLSRP